MGNKIDREYLRSVTREEASEYAAKNAMQFIEVSALNGTGINQLFDLITIECLKKIQLMGADEKIHYSLLADNNGDLQTYRDVIDLFVNSQTAITPTVLAFKRIQREMAACNTIDGVREKIQEMKQAAVASPAILEKLNAIFDENNRLTIQDEAAPVLRRNSSCGIL